MKSKILWIFLAFFVVSSAAWTDEQERKFQKWKTAYNKKYETPEAEQKARDAMLQNDGKIEEHNKRFKEGKETFKRGLWKRSDLSYEEKKKLLASAKNFPSNSSNLLQAAPRRRLKAPIPESVNWAKLGMVHEVEDQRTCGSCYAFATVGVIEGVMLKKGIKTRLSVQQIIDCDRKNLGCGGGDPMVSLKYAKSAGLGDASTYKYMNKRGKCQTVEPVSEISSVMKADLKGNEIKLKEIVAQYGPVAGNKKKKFKIKVEKILIFFEQFL